MADTAADYALLLRWLADERVLEWYEGRDAQVSEDWIRDTFSPRTLGVDRVVPCIFSVAGQPLGYLQYYPLQEAELQEYALATGTPAYGVDLFIGEPEAWSKGTGTRLLRALLHFLFAELDAEIVTIDPQVGNVRAIRCYEKAGFARMRVLPQHEYHEGSWRDNLLMIARKPLR